ncbi:MAG TPA: carbamoyltransferase C-terminal domain-containing protein [Pilimelia sp.]|nr:carbamoyltransferase C-terminal domain-containing protein [Pilimelia sp.]
MLICGLKLTHDGGLAVVDGDRLLFSTELEKVDGNRRYQPLDRLELVDALLAREGLRIGDIDRYVVDGWFPAPGQDRPRLPLRRHGAPVTLEVAPYAEGDAAPGAGPLHRYRFAGLPLADGEVPYHSYHHAAQHVLGAYLTSPFAADGRSALVLVWDGGMVPTLYQVRPDPVRARNLGTLMPVYGSAFADFAAQFEPFRAGDVDSMVDDHLVPPHLDVAGKAMAFAALGRDEAGFYPVLDAALGRLPLTFDAAAELARQVDAQRDTWWPGCADSDLIATFQGYLGHRLRRSLRARVAALVDAGVVAAADGEHCRWCLAGGCALNIKWNSALRAADLGEALWIPPFPNDSGAALGTAAVELSHAGGARLRWTPRSGPRLTREPLPAGWDSRPCDAAGLAALLHEEGEPVVVLHGRAELGPRALGGRSILAPATDPKMKGVLNDVKDREFYRPVAPVCRVERAAEIFDPGCPDPYMLFDHRVRPGWAERIPAVVHLDGTARLQTVHAADDPLLAAVLRAYERRSGVPVLCNTSANARGRGFFPSAAAAARWGRTRYIWSDGLLHTRRA